MFVFGRFIRNAKAAITYPIWLCSDKPGPDNHIYKRRRVVSIAHRYSCETFIETGTFYGQMTNAVKRHFKNVLSVELFERIDRLNKTSFSIFQTYIFTSETAPRYLRTCWSMLPVASYFGWMAITVVVLPPAVIK